MVLKSITNRFCSWFFLILYTLSSKPMTIIPEQKCVETFYVCICICICFLFCEMSFSIFQCNIIKLFSFFGWKNSFTSKMFPFSRANICCLSDELFHELHFQRKLTENEYSIENSVSRHSYMYNILFAKFLIDSYTTKLAIYNNERFCKINNKHKFLKKKEKIISQTILYFT